MNNGVSIIIPVYNRTHQLKEALDSVFDQTYKTVEVIVIDDASTVNIKEILNLYKNHDIKLLTNKINSGVSFSRNKGIKISKYDYIALLDSDDRWNKHKLQRQIDFLNTHKNLNLVHTDEIWIRNGKQINQKKHHQKSGGDIFEQSLKLCAISPSATMVRKEIFNNYGFFDESMRACEDYDLWMRITSQEEVGFINEKLTIKTGGHSDQLSQKYDAMDQFRVYSLIKNYNALKLTSKQKHQITQMILKKSKILLGGAIKRANTTNITKYQNIIKDFSCIIG